MPPNPAYDALFAQSRDLLCDGLCAGLATIMGGAEASITDALDKATDQDLKKIMTEARDLARTQRPTIEKQFRADNAAFFENAKATRAQFRAAKEANDQAKLDSLKPTMEAQRAQMKQLRQAVMDKIRNILTADQRAQLDAFKAQHESRRDQK